jgi:hypothetical protein
MPNHEASVVIKRSVEEVFAFVENPKNELIWRHSRVEADVETVVDAKDDPDDGLGGEIGLGATGREVSKSLGNKFESTWEITEYEQNKKVVYRSASGPGKYESVWTYESVDGGTNVTVATEWELIDRENIGRMSDRVLEKTYRKSVDGDLQTLKRLLEA